MRSAILLAGGHSRRMGQNKALLPFGDTTLGQQVYASLQQACDEIIVVTHHPEWFPGAHCVPDRLPDQGPLEGLASGLDAIHSERAILLACDMPFFSAALIRRLFELACDQGVLVPVTAEGLQPFGAIYHRRVRQALHTYQQAGGRSLKGFLDDVRCHCVPANQSAFVNVNRPEDYLKALNTCSGLNT